MSDDSELLRRRLDAIQTELRTMLLRDEQRAAAYQSQLLTLTHQIVEIDQHLLAISGRFKDVILESTPQFARVESKLELAAERFEERMDALEALISGRR